MGWWVGWVDRWICGTHDPKPRVRRYIWTRGALTQISIHVHAHIHGIGQNQTHARAQSVSVRTPGLDVLNELQGHRELLQVQQPCVFFCGGGGGVLISGVVFVCFGFLVLVLVLVSGVFV